MLGGFKKSQLYVLGKNKRIQWQRHEVSLSLTEVQKDHRRIWTWNRGRKVGRAELREQSWSGHLVCWIWSFISCIILGKPLTPQSICLLLIGKRESQASPCVERCLGPGESSRTFYSHFLLVPHWFLSWSRINPIWNSWLWDPSLGPVRAFGKVFVETLLGPWFSPLTHFGSRLMS